MLPSPKKYRLSLLIESLVTAGRARGEVITDLCELLGIQKDMLQKYRSCRQSETLSLSGNQLTKLAAYFNCSIDELITPVTHAEAN